MPSRAGRSSSTSSNGFSRTDRESACVGSVLYMSMSLDGYIAGPNDKPGNPGGDNFMRLHKWYGFASDGCTNGGDR